MTFCEGISVRHMIFGKGIVKKIEKRAHDVDLITIEFSQNRVKQFRADSNKIVEK